MILKRAWTAQDLGKRSAFANAAKGVTTWAMIDFSDNDVVEMYMTASDYAQATHITSGEVNKLWKKLKARVPATSDKLILMLKRYTNFLYAMFSSRCPLYLKMRKILSALLDLHPSAQDRMSHNVRASILWIIQVQSRKFAKGRMIKDDREECLFEFSNLLNVLQTKNCHSIYHDELPNELREKTGIQGVLHDTKRVASTLGCPPATMDQPMRDPKKQKQTQRIMERYNKKLEAYFEEAMKIANNPGLQRVCDYCGVTKKSLVPNLDVRQDCQQFLILGWCGFKECGKCILNHRTATPEQVETIMKGTIKFVDNPKGMMSGKSNESK